MNVTQARMKMSSGLRRIRPANAPMINAGVMAANFNWKAKKRSAGMVDEYAVLAEEPTPFNAKYWKFPMNPPSEEPPKASVYPQMAQARLTTAKMAMHWTMVETRFFLRTRPP